MRKRTTIRVITFLSAALVVACVLAFTGQRRAHSLELYARSSSQRAFDELVTNVSELSNALEKSVYITDPALEGALCTQIFARAATAQSMMGALPYSSDQLERTSSFLSMVGDYACVLARTVGANGGYSEEELSNLTELADTANVMAMDLRDMQSRIMAGRLTMDEVYAETASADLADDAARTPMAGTAIRSIEEEFPELPTLIYDGPFSDAVLSATPRYLEGLDEVSEDEAQKAAARFLGVDSGELIALGDVGGRIPCHSYGAYIGGGEYTVMVTRQGGEILSVLCSRLPGIERLSVENGLSIARDFLEKQGFEDMKESYHMAEGGVLTVNYEYEQDGVICYPDLVKIGVALDNGSIVSWDAKGYLSAHYERTLDDPSVSVREALEMISPLLTVRSYNMALIPSDGGEERLCHEFRCEAEDGRQFLLYVNALTGAQERIMILLRDDAGTLTI